MRLIAPHHNDDKKTLLRDSRETFTGMNPIIVIRSRKR
jgi:hypothetical protein